MRRGNIIPKSNNKSLTFVFFSLAYLISLFKHSHGLQCYTCYPCGETDPGNLEMCDEAAYANLPDRGYHGCSYEIGAGGVRRKRCIWLRNDPDDQSVPANPRPLRCNLSPFDDENLDCFCFTSGCNKDKLEEPTTTVPPELENSKATGQPEIVKPPYNGQISSTKATNLGRFSCILAIAIIALAQSFGMTL